MKKKENSPEKPLQMRKHPFRQKFMSGLLCICLMLVSFPAELYGAKVLAEAPSRKVLSFSPLPEGVRQQTVGKGTDFGELNLPDTLTAVCIPLENGSAAAGGNSGKFSDISVVSGKGLEKQASTDITPGDGTGTAGNEETTGNEESTGITGNEENTESTGEEDYTSNTDNVGNEEEVPAGPENFETGAVEEETLAIGPVTWASLPEYNGGTEGTYTFFPTLPENYQLSGQTELPKITVTVQKAGEFRETAENTAITVDFYSREAGKMETITAETGDSQGSGTILAPQLQEMPGWMPVGWSTSPEGFAGDIAAGSEITVTEDTAYYGVYQKEVCLSYQGNGARTVPGPELKISYANVHQEITYSIPSFTIASAPDYSGAAFQGWNTKEDGGGETYPAGSTQQLGNSTILYAIWGKAPEGNPDNIPEEKPEEPKEPVQYTVEHYKQELEGDGYVKEEGDTEVLLGEKGTAVEAKAKDYSGFSLNASHPLGKVSGTAEEGLVLKMYYDRDIYEIAFDLNGGHGTAPETQKIRWGGLLGEVPDPERAGYHFKGWYLEENGLDLGLWDFGHPVENNTGNLHTTLYAMWADETAPVLGEASYSTGHKDFLNWIIQKESIIISVLVTEEGSGLAKAEYVLAAEDETEKEGLAQIEEKRGQAENSMAYGSSGFVIRALQGAAETGIYEAIVTVEEEFKGKVYLTCTDKEGNQSAQKIITSLGGGIIVEDNAPEISFSNTKEKIAGKDIKANVRIEDAKDGSVSGGIAKVFYQLDGAEKITLPKKNFQKELVETYQFKVKVSGAGEHTLKVTAVDNAGNRNTRQVSLRISKEKKDEAEKESPEETDGSKTDGTPIVPEIPGGGNRPGGSGWPSGTEPKTGDSTHIKIYATVAMIAGFSYLLLYFEGEHGITEQEKEEIVYRLVSWAKKGGTARRMLGLAAIFFFLAYYHSIGKSVPVEWREVYQCKS